MAEKVDEKDKRIKELEKQLKETQKELNRKTDALAEHVHNTWSFY